MHAMEIAIDEIARKLDIDPIDIRLKNAAKEGTQAPYGPKFPAIGFIECLEAAKQHPNYTAPVPEGAGRGVAAGFWFNVGMQSSAEVHINEDGTVQVIEGNPDIGGSRASMCLMARGNVWACLTTRYGRWWVIRNPPGSPMSPAVRARRLQPAWR